MKLTIYVPRDQSGGAGEFATFFFWENGWLQSSAFHNLGGDHGFGLSWLQLSFRTLFYCLTHFCSGRNVRHCRTTMERVHIPKRFLMIHVQSMTHTADLRKARLRPGEHKCQRNITDCDLKFQISHISQRICRNCLSCQTVWFILFLHFQLENRPQ